MRHKLVAVFICVVAGWGCTPEAPSFNSLFKSFDRQGMLTNMGNNMVIPAYEELYTDMNALNASLSALKANTGTPELLAAQTAWKNVNTRWRACEVYGFGPVDYLLIKLKIDNYTTSPTNINNNISGAGGPFTDAYVNTLPVSDKGLVALEYLLFGDGVNDPLSLFTADTQRVNYALALGTNLQNQVNTVRNEWLASGNNYIHTFIINDGNNVSSSLGKIMNYIVMFADEMKNMKLGKPMGKIDAVPMPETVESYYSKQSLPNLEANVTALEKLFTGNSQPGLNALLDHLGVKDGNGLLLSDKLEQKFAEVHTNIAAINSPLDQAVTSNPTACEALYTSVGDLYVLLKVDAMNQLGLLLTFTDNDGD